MKDKLKKIALKAGLDALGILLCSGLAKAAPDLVPSLSGLELPLAVASGIWLYIPLRGLIDKLASKWKK